jgi:cysteine desulfurase
MRPEVWDAMRPFVNDAFGNSTGPHSAARAAKNALEEARERVAATIGARPNEIVFTGGGTESDNLAVKGALVFKGARGEMVTSAIEHQAVLESGEAMTELGCSVLLVDADRDGVVQPDSIVATVTPDTTLVSLMAANNETGVIQPVIDTVLALRDEGFSVLVHTDAVQAYSSERLDVRQLGVDLLSLAAHKFGGPKGMGILYVREGVGLAAGIHGGGQELGRRSGTANVMGAVGTAVAMERASTDRTRYRKRVAAERDEFEAILADQRPDVSVTGEDVRRLPGHSHVTIENVDSQILLMKLDRADVSVSTGSSCKSGAASASHVLLSMGMDIAQARSALRYSFGWTSMPGDGALAARTLIQALR